MAQCLVKNYRHNKFVLDNLEEGDLISIKENILYSHWAVYAGDDKVVHLSGKDDVSSEFAFVKLENFWKVVGNKKAKKNNKKDKERTPFRGKDIVKRALSMIGPNAYNLLCNNCEHFATWCRYDKKKSDQVDKALTVVSVVGGIAVAAGLLHEMFKDDE
ncbi:phospholipase A and acyltransferase 2-like [Mytilus californianus]|uniref:phospholipase A and acyltransferase 2-like n=1 Tax=Mytilus californianus TaxID=6549 RepID=UPI0022450E3E|nr:phospholipase A and acyltransferase 2-like [Mytilus californianus]